MQCMYITQIQVCCDVQQKIVRQIAESSRGFCLSRGPLLRWCRFLIQHPKELWFRPCWNLFDFRYDKVGFPVYDHSCALLKMVGGIKEVLCSRCLLIFSIPTWLNIIILGNYSINILPESSVLNNNLRHCWWRVGSWLHSWPNSSRIYCSGPFEERTGNIIW